MYRYNSSLDRLSIIITWCVFALSMVIFCTGYFAYLKSGKQISLLIGPGLAPVILIGLITAMYYLKPIAVTIGNNAITIDRKWYPVTIDFSDIKSIRIVEKEEMKGVIRTFGNGGLFGYTGSYYNKKMGSMRWYCTQRCNFIMIETSGNKIIITPDSPMDFMNDIKSVERLFVGNQKTAA